MVLKYLPTLKKIKNAEAQADRKEESKMTMTRKLNKDNGLQDWKTEHQAVTSGIVNCRCLAYSSGTARIKSSFNLIRKYFEIGN